MVDSPLESSAAGLAPRLIAIYGPLNDRTLYLDEPVVSIGRHASNDIILNDPYVSRHHCLIRRVGEQYVIEDLDSANGTSVNGEWVKVSSLKEGALIRVGNSLFLFRLQSHDELLASCRNRLEPEHLCSPLEEIRWG